MNPDKPIDLMINEFFSLDLLYLLLVFLKRVLHPSPLDSLGRLP